MCACVCACSGACLCVCVGGWGDHRSRARQPKHRDRVAPQARRTGAAAAGSRATTRWMHPGSQRPSREARASSRRAMPSPACSWSSPLAARSIKSHARSMGSHHGQHNTHAAPRPEPTHQRGSRCHAARALATHTSAPARTKQHRQRQQRRAAVHALLLTQRARTHTLSFALLLSASRALVPRGHGQRPPSRPWMAWTTTHAHRGSFHRRGSEDRQIHANRVRSQEPEVWMNT